MGEASPDVAWPTKPTNPQLGGSMTPVLLLLAFLLVIDALVLLGRSYDSRDGRDWQPRSSLWPDQSAVGLI
jgi:hypothetical protein